MSDNTNDEDVRFSWLVRAADALGRYMAHGGELRIADAEDGERITCLIILPGETAGVVSAAVGNGQWRERHGKPPPSADQRVTAGAQQQAQPSDEVIDHLLRNMGARNVAGAAVQTLRELDECKERAATLARALRRAKGTAALAVSIPYGGRNYVGFTESQFDDLLAYLGQGEE